MGGLLGLVGSMRCFDSVRHQHGLTDCIAGGKEMQEGQTLLWKWAFWEGFGSDVPF